MSKREAEGRRRDEEGEKLGCNGEGKGVREKRLERKVKGGALNGGVMNRGEVERSSRRANKGEKSECNGGGREGYRNREGVWEKRLQGKVKREA